MSLPIDEIFGNAVQGEGSRMGVPSIFVRTGGCNLTCKGFGCKSISALDNTTEITGCDSIHAVNAKHFKHTWTYYDEFIDLVKDIEAKFPQSINPSKLGNAEPVDIIFTGGEPLLHYKDDVLTKTMEYFISRGHKVWFETNGTVPIDFDKFPIFKEVNFSMSVKMSASGEAINKRWKPEVVNEYIKNTKESYFKFVLSAKSLKEEQQEIFEFLGQVPTFGTVYCMPLGETKTQLEENAYDVYEFCAKNGFRYSDRLHIRIHNDLRGV
jgi:organic radical activating enzyme